MNKYKYQGKVETVINGYGVVKPRETIETELEINHPLFRKIRERKEK